MSEMYCGSCRHWRPPEERDDFRQVLRVYPIDGDYDRVRGISDTVDRMFGTCGAIQLGDEIREDEAIPFAVTKDGSDYMADLFTRREFGCALHEPRD